MIFFCFNAYLYLCNPQGDTIAVSLPISLYSDMELYLSSAVLYNIFWTNKKNKKIIGPKNIFFWV